MFVRPLIAVLISLNILVWGSLFAFEHMLANGTLSGTATMTHRNVQVVGAGR